MTDRVTQAESRRVFGADAAAYDAGRPAYPDAVYDIVSDRCGLAPGIAAFEIGPGTGHATRAVLARGVGSLVAVEPDPALAAFLRRDDALDRARLRLIERPFAEAGLPDDTFDLGFAAASFHWLDAAPALAAVRRALKPGGGWAMWWTIHRDIGSDDPFERASDAILARFPLRQSRGTNSDHPFALDTGARLGEVAAAGLADGAAHRLRWSMRMDADAVIALLGSFSPVRLMTVPDRAALFAAFREAIDGAFGGTVERWFTTMVYTARKPG